jgi:hypothetical protein
MNKEDYVIVINGAKTAEISGEEIETTEESIYSNIKDEPATLPEAIQLAWQGMLGIFIVALTIILVASFLNLVTTKKGKKKED